MTSASSRGLLVGLAVLGLLAPLAPAGALAGQANTDVTYVEHDVTESTTWTPENGPYRVATDVTVRDGATLTVEPGTTVQPAEDVTITVRGNLTANGTAANPVTFAPAPGAPSDVRWGTLRYDGTQRSRLSLSHVSLRRATDGVTITSPNGAVAVSSSTVRTIDRDGIRVAGTRGTPRVEVTDSTFSGVGGRGVALTPGAGAVADAHITPNRTELDERATHNVSLTPAVDTTFRTVRVEYRGHARVDHVGYESLEWLGIDTDGDETIDRLLNSSVVAVRRPAPDVVEFRLDRNVTVPGETSLIASYSDVTNPKTYGTYPVAVRLQAHGVDQLAPTTLPLHVRSTGPRRGVAADADRSRASRFHVTGSTFESVGGQGVFVAADAASYFSVASNTFAGVRGTGVTVRGERVYSGRIERNRLSEIGAGADGVRLSAQRLADTGVRRNTVTGADAGVRLVARNDGVDGVAVTSNEVTDSATGLQVRGGANRLRIRLSLTVADNAFSANRRHGMAVTGRYARLVDTAVRDNDLAANGRTGLRIDADHVARSTLANNTVTDNGRSGMAITGQQVRKTRVVDNEIADNDEHGVSMRTGLLVYNVSVDSNRVLDNAGAGFDLRNELTHAGWLALADNTVAANAYGVRVAGTLNASVRDNTVVYNTYRPGGLDEVDGDENGTGIVVEDGVRGALFRADAVEDELDDLIDDREVEGELPEHTDDTYAVVLRPNRSGDARRYTGSAFSVRSVSADIPTGIALSKDDDRRAGVNVTGNDVYGHDRGLVVNVGTLVDANTTDRLLVDATRTVTAERNYWGAADGPVHSSIRPEGTGDRVVTHRGWVDFVPFAESSFEPRHHRPEANLTVSPEPGRPGEPVVVSGRRSTDGDGTVSTYRFEINGSTRTSSDPNLSTSFDAPGSYNVSLVVEDDMGVESAARAQRTIAVREPPETTVESPGTTTARNRTTTATTGTSATTDTPATTTPASSSETGPLDAVFGSLGGLFGLVLYGAGLALGAYGTLQTFYANTVTVSGRTINGLAGAGVLAWIGFGLLGTDGLLAAGLGGVVLWIGLVVLLWVAIRVVGQ